MSFVDALSAASGDTSNRKKRTRTRKRRTRTEPEGEASEHEEEEQPSKKSAKVAATSTPADDQDIDTKYHEKKGQDDDRRVSGDNVKGKRKRKRTRGRGKEGQISKGDTETVIEASNPTNQASSRPSAAGMQEYLKSLGDPLDKKDKLHEKTINALGYARQYHLARTEWKFNKAKQEYLIRHMLTPPPCRPTDEIDNSSSRQGVVKKKQEDDEDAAISDQQHWPDEWNRCVAKYLATIQGKARERLFDMLTKAAQQIIPPMPLQVIPAVTTPIEGAILATEKKSVSFGDLAMAQDAASNKGSDPLPSVSIADVQRRQFQKDRATRLLAELQD